MIRVIIGTVAVLAGFTVVERSVKATWGPAGSCPPFQAHAAPNRGEMVSLRIEPMADGASPAGDRPALEKRPVSSVPPCPEPVEAPKSGSSGR